jgi:regulator of sigma E protease
MILKPAIGVVEANSYADQAGLEFGDKIIRVGDMAAIEWESTLAAILGEMVDDGRVPLTLAGSDGRERQTTLQVGSDKSRLTEPGALFDGLGFVPWQPPAIIATLSQDGPAISSGLAIGDRITTIDGETIGSFEDLRISVQPRAGKEVIVEFIREEQPGVVDVQIGERIINDKSQGYLGVGWSNEGGEDFYQRVDYTLLESLNSAINRTWTSTIFTINMLGGMLTGDVSIKNISGPIKIAQIAGESAERGWRYFVGIMAIISISLGVLNLLPIPVLDGGQIIYQLIEGFKGSPMTERAQIIGQQAGILALLMLMSFAFYNDISGILS